jgi:hypothetical protein
VIYDVLLGDGRGHIQRDDTANYAYQRCMHCGNSLIWLEGKRIYPLTSAGPAPDADMPVDVRADYVEAQVVAPLSPRGAAALLRLAIDKLTAGLYPDKARTPLNDRIGWMDKQGYIGDDIQQMLDAGRVIGNHAVHPGELDLQATPELVESLFWVTNELVEDLIAKPERRKAIYDSLPEADRQRIERRDGRVPA